MNTFKALQKRHEKLLEQQEQVSIADVQAYIDDVIAAGHKIANHMERQQLRANLRYWANLIHTAKGVYPDIELAPGPTLQIRNWVHNSNVRISILILIIAVIVSANNLEFFSTSSTPTPPLPSTCPSVNAEGTVPPSVAITSITFIVNGDEQIVANQYMPLQASPGDEVKIKEITVCVEPFDGESGSGYVEFDPLDQNGQVMALEVKGTRSVRIASGFTIIPGPDYAWTIGDNWRHLSVVTVHYPPGGGTQNPNCEGGFCEVDDRMIVPIE